MFKNSRVRRRNPLGAEPLANVGSTDARCREWLGGILPKGSRQATTDFRWLLASTNFDKIAALRDATPGIFQNAEPLA
jgi:hypothetical protein